MMNYPVPCHLDWLLNTTFGHYTIGLLFAVGLAMVFIYKIDSKRSDYDER